MATPKSWFTETNTTDEFICPDTGRYENPSSTNYQYYYLCAVDASGNLYAVLTKCPSSTVFSPKVKKCVLIEQYQITTPAPETRTADREYSIEEPFQCSKAGRYPHRQSIDCKSYIICTLDESSGVFVSTLAECPSNTIFSWKEKRCVLNHQYSCFNQYLQNDDLIASSTESLSTTSFESFEQPLVNYECLTTGRFPNLNSSDCSTYFICTMGLDGIILAMLASCPTNTIFSWDSNKCVVSSSYVCPNFSTLSPTTSDVPELSSLTGGSFTTTPLTSSTSTVHEEDDKTTELALEPETSTIAPSSPTATPASENFECTSTGRFPDTEQADCIRYKYCLKSSQGAYLEFIFTCPTATFFNPVESRCSASYTCPLTPVSTIVISSTPHPFKCTEDGRFPDPESITCNTYIYCLQTANGEFLKHTFNCPAGSFFSPYEGRCSVAYVC
ncbi:uncharacterized protein LOC129718620 [Wyeomyia smithii]|uniref:uncharacterized protein LOC129718620 n=1 Tax=Wyeomyia smithii TaxID=174621 RepID=UPI002467CB9E|nr:uncharacterized protein LOC129718620 [Wyeomyia smithii]XP_055525531.1 uncharacterized protein LOC129718620 [Wyeomyia smithii]